MKSRLLSVALACVIGVGAAQSLEAQAHADPLDAVSAAVISVRDAIWRGEELPGGPIRFDPRIVTTREVTHPAHRSPITVREFGPARSPELSRDLLAALSARPVNFDSVEVCPSRDLRSCHLADGAAAAFAASEPRLEGNTAEVIVRAVWLSKIPKQPVQSGTFSVVLTRVGTCWRITDTKTLTIS